ncbi:MAG: Lpp/OprI family alanine-zipper lipoprotein [Candidatus Nitrosotenuis sp.]
MKYIGFSVIAVLIGVASLTGCASKSDVTDLQIQIDGLKAQVFETKTTTNAAKDSVARAADLADSAEKSAAAAAKSIEDFNSKIDAAFTETQVK